MNKEKLINYLAKRLTDSKELYRNEYDEDFKFYLKGEIDLIRILLIRLNDGDFD